MFVFLSPFSAGPGHLVQALTFETKRELLRNLSGLSRGFSASASALSAIHATREMDSARRWGVEGVEKSPCSIVKIC